MAFTQSLAFRIGGGSEISANFDFVDTGVVNITLLGPDPSDTASATWVFDLGNKSLQFSAGTVIGAHGACIIQCVGIAVGKALLECLLGSRSLAEIEECLKGKAIGAIAAAIECIARCLGLVP